MLKLAGAYRREWCDLLQSSDLFLRVGFANYDAKNYTEALYVFEAMGRFADTKQDKFNKAIALIWQGHQLDLLRRRSEAIARYKQAADMDIQSSIEHSQYGLRYQPSAYAKKRMATPFVRLENKER